MTKKSRSRNVRKKSSRRSKRSNRRSRRRNKSKKNLRKVGGVPVTAACRTCGSTERYHKCPGLFPTVTATCRTCGSTERYHKCPGLFPTSTRRSTRRSRRITPTRSRPTPQSPPPTRRPTTGVRYSSPRRNARSMNYNFKLDSPSGSYNERGSRPMVNLTKDRRWLEDRFTGESKQLANIVASRRSGPGGLTPVPQTWKRKNMPNRF